MNEFEKTLWRIPEGKENGEVTLPAVPVWLIEKARRYASDYQIDFDVVFIIALKEFLDDSGVADGRSGITIRSGGTDAAPERSITIPGPWQGVIRRGW